MKLRIFIFLPLLIFSILLINIASTTAQGPIPLCDLDIEVMPDFCKFLLSIHNDGDSEIILQFTSSKQYDVEVKSLDGNNTWKWSSDKMFAQSLTEITLMPGEDKVFLIKNSFPKGEYYARGIIPLIGEEIKTDWMPFSVSSEVKPILSGKITKILDNVYLLGDDGTSYHIEEKKEELEQLSGEKIEVIDYEVYPIPGDIDKTIVIKEYRNT